MRLSELFRLVRLNLLQNKFKVILTSIGIIVGAATVVMVIGIGKGGQAEVAEQFKNLNAGAIDISYEGSGSTMGAGSSDSSGGMPSMGGDSGGMPSMGGGDFSGGRASSGSSSSGSSSSGGGGATGGGFSGEMPSMGGSGGKGGFVIGGSGSDEDRINQESVTLTMDDVDDIETFVPDISAVSISYTTKQDIEGGELEEATSYTIGGVLANYADISNLSLQMGDFLTDTNEDNAEKVCVLGATAATEIFGSALDAYGSVVYIDGRPYVVNGILEEVGTVASGISPDEAVFIPYSTGIKYITGDSVSPTITVIAEDVDNVSTVTANIETILAENYPNTEFTITDAGSKMEAASASNDVLTMLLYAMAVIVFCVGGIGIMNVLFVTVKERTKEIGILKSMGCSKKDILLEFIFEACSISVIGGVLGIAVSLVITPIADALGVPVILSPIGAGLALIFAILTGTIFGFYPALKASRLIPVEALSEE